MANFGPTQTAKLGRSIGKFAADFRDKAPKTRARRAGRKGRAEAVLLLNLVMPNDCSPSALIGQNGLIL
jgi:hypothetical protein